MGQFRIESVGRFLILVTGVANRLRAAIFCDLSIVQTYEALILKSFYIEKELLEMSY